MVEQMTSLIKDDAFAGRAREFRILDLPGQAGPNEPTNTWPVFNANSSPYQKLGLLKVAEMAAQKHGSLVLLRLGGDREAYLLTGQQSVWCWHDQTAKFPAEFANLTSNTIAMNLLLGNGVEAESNVACLLRQKQAALEHDLDRWFDETLELATLALVDEASASASDLRQLCRLWSVRAVCHTIFGTALPDADMAAGLLLVEEFYAVMNSASGSEPEVLEHLRQTRAFLDRVLCANMAVAQSGERTVLACLLDVLPGDVGQEARLNYLRPILFGILDEKLSIEGMNLLWALIHLAQNQDLVEAIAAEAALTATHETRGLSVSYLALSVAKETQRLYPQIPFIHRTVSQDVQFDGQTIPARATVLFAPWLVHRDECYWAEPTRFNGSRFLGIETPHFPFGNTLHARQQADFIRRHVAVAVSSVCISHRFTLAPESLPGNLRPVLRAILEPRGRVQVSWSPRPGDSGGIAPTLSSKLHNEEKIAW
jgi:hypothetical protein